MGDPMLRLMELDARHTELLERLSELDQRVGSVLDEWTKTKTLLAEAGRSDAEQSATQPAVLPEQEVLSL